MISPCSIETGKSIGSNLKFWKSYELNELQEKKVTKITVKVTKYNAVPEQTDDTPTITASNKTIEKGVVALSRDIEEELGLKFGDKIYLKGLGYYIFEDRMNKKWTRRVDIYEKSILEAKKFGIVETELIK